MATFNSINDLFSENPTSNILYNVCYEFCVMAVRVSVYYYANFLSDAFLLLFCRWVVLAYDNWDFRKSFDYSQSLFFRKTVRMEASTLTSSHLGFKCTELT